MSKSSGSHLPPNFQRRAFYGIANFTTWKGQQIVRAWPRKRPGPGTPAQQDARDNFRHMVDAVKGMMAEDHAIARDLAHASGYTWRDVLSAHVLGGFVQVDGLEMLSAQAALDLISDVPGTMLYRAADAWVGLAPGAQDEVLTLNAGFPEWIQPAPPASSGAWVIPALDGSPTSWGNGGLSAYFTPTVGAADGDCYDVMVIGKRAPASGTIGIAVKGASDDKGYVWGVQGDGNNVLSRINVGTYSTLRASGTSGTGDANVYCHARMMISFTAGFAFLSPIGVAPLHDHQGFDFHTSGVKFGVWVTGTSTPIKLVYTKISALA